MDEFQEIEKVKNFLLSNMKPAYLTTNKRELRVRCPYCGDSKNDKTHAHLYIQLKPPFKFYCQKCNSAGVLNQKSMRDFQLYDSDISISLSDLSKAVESKKGFSNISFKKQNFKFPVVDSPISRECCRYFNNRYNSNFSNEEIVNNFKAITDAGAFFSENNINIINNQYDFSKAIGFMSADTSHIIFRDTSGMQPRRYFNLALTPDDYYETSKFYTIKTKVDILSPEVNLVLTEGIFDIIGVYNNFFKGKTENTIFAAACGKGYNSVILNLIKKGFLNLNIQIFSDADVDTSFYKNLKNSSQYLRKLPITIFYNKIGKDFGVPREQIQLSKIIL